MRYAKFVKPLQPQGPLIITPSPSDSAQREAILAFGDKAAL